MATETETSIEAKLPQQSHWALSLLQNRKIRDEITQKNHDTTTQGAVVKSASETCWDHGGKAFPINTSRELEYKTNIALTEPLDL